MKNIFDKSPKGVETVCSDCKQRLFVLIEAKCYTCPKCGWHQKFDAAGMNDKLKQILGYVFGAPPAAPHNN